MTRVEPHLEAVERLRRLHPPFVPGGWTRDQFIDAGMEGRRRWLEAQELFELQWPMFTDAVTVISPSFVLESRFSDVARATRIPVRRNVENRVAMWFMNWARCPLTAAYPNPYEPWIEIWEHGGSFSVEHGQFVDLHDASGQPVGA